MSRAPPAGSLALALLLSAASGRACAAEPGNVQLPDWSGSWRRTTPELPFAYFKKNPPPFTEAARHKIETVAEGLIKQADLSAPGLYCQPFSYVGDNGGLLDTFEFLMTPGRVTLINEMGLVRRIFTDARALPANALETNAGSSVGHWEGETLVVDTVALDSDARYPVEQFDGVPAIGKRAWSHERIFLKAPDLLEIDTDLSAPEMLSATYHTSFTYTRDRQHLPAGISFCVHNDRSIDPLTGHQRLDLTPPEGLPPPPQ